MKIYLYTPGGYGTSIATALEGDVRFAPNPARPGDRVRGGERKGVQHNPAKRLHVLRDDQRQCPGRAGPRFADGVLLRLHARLAGMIMRIPEVGSQYLMGFLDKDNNPFDGARTYKVTLPRRTFLPAHSGRSRCTTTRRARCLTGPSAIRAPAARAIRLRPPNRTPTAPRPSTSVRPSRRGQAGQLDPHHARQGLVSGPRASTAA
jgi:hypothetical protein